MESSGKIGKAMVKAGYSPKTDTTNLTKSKGWHELMDKYLPDDELLAVHQKALHATKIHGSLTEPDREVEDIPTQIKAVELGYKVKRRLTPDTLNQLIVGEQKIIVLDGGEANYDELRKPKGS